MCAKIASMTLEERETHLNLSGADRAAGKDWEMYTDDPIIIADMERKKIQCVRSLAGGGRFYSVPQNQITIRKKRVMTDEARAALSQRAKENFGKGGQISALSMRADLDDDDEEEDDEE